MTAHAYRTIRRIAGEVVSVVFVEGSQRFVTGHAGDGNVRVWDIANTDEPEAVTQHDSVVLCLALSPDNRWLMSGGHAGLKVFDLRTWKERPVTGMKRAVNSISFDTTGKRVAVYYSGVVQVLDIESLTVCCDPVLSQVQTRSQVVFLPTRDDLLLTEFYYSRRSATGGDVARLVHRWSLDSGCLITRYRAPRGIKQFAVSCCGRIMATTCHDDQTRVWDVDTGTVLHTIPINGRPVALHPQGNIVAIGHRAVTLWDINAQCPLMELDGAPQWRLYSQLRFSADGCFLAATGDSATIWEITLSGDAEPSAHTVTTAPSHGPETTTPACAPALRVQ